MFTFKLIRDDGTAVDPPTFVTAAPSWKEGETFLLRPGHVYRIVEVRDAEDAHGVSVARVLVRAQLEIDLCDVEHGGEVGLVFKYLGEDRLSFFATEVPFIDVVRHTAGDAIELSHRSGGGPGGSTPVLQYCAQ